MFTSDFSSFRWVEQKNSAHGVPISALGRILLVAAITPHLKKSDPLYPMLALPDGLVWSP